MAVMTSDVARNLNLAAKLVSAFGQAGFTPTELNQLAENNISLLEGVRHVLHGNASISVAENIIDCDADPFIPDGWKVEEHQKGGTFKFEASKVELFLSEPQKRGRSIKGNKLRTTLKGQPVLNANVLDYLLAHPNLIPEEWKGKFAFFWGTIYRGSDGRLFVRCLCWYGGWRCRWLGHDFHDDNPAALRASWQDRLDREFNASGI